ncbi:MAG TPA: hypothetical protein H9774_03310 [Candidatus Desulfovibrio gallistercoris]|nr:hypothetical protein [Candidatus Desulfovibrio gallistercoris]
MSTTEPLETTAQTSTPPARRPAVNTRKLAMRVMLGTLGVSLALGLAGKSKAHVLTGLVFSGLLADHIWKRRKAL